MTVSRTLTSAPTTTEKLPSPEPTLILRVLERRWLTLIPYIVGIAWICLHPVVSIITGELKCRGWFIDESSLDAGHFRLRANGFQSYRQQTVRGITTLCDAIEIFGFEQGNLDCFRHGDNGDEIDHNNTFDVAKLVPVSNAVTPISEAIVLVIPASNDWLSTPFAMDVMFLLRNLSTAPWLAKTVLLVAPTTTTTTTTTKNHQNNALDDTVRDFLKAYLNQKGLPSSYTTAMIRNLLVLDVRSPTSSDGRDDEEQPPLLILPQGRKGLLPNLDLVFLTMMVYSRITTNIMMHPYYRTNVASWIPYPRYSKELLDMLLFMKTMAIGPYPPHSAALEYGIDSLTIQTTHSFNRASKTSNTSNTRVLEPLELVIRALSNLHERLHHSVTQYLLPSPVKFVSHAEYLVPHILLLLPLAIQAMRLTLVDMMKLKFDFMSLQITVWVFCAGACVQYLSVLPTRTSFTSTTWSSEWQQQLSMPSPSLLHRMNTLMVILYAALVPLVHIMTRRLPKEKASRDSLAQSFMFVTCLCTIYLSLPLILGHVSLATPTVLFWSFISLALSSPLSSPSSSSFHIFSNFMTCLLMIMTWPPFVVQFVFGYYSPYVCMVHLPLHLLTSIRLILTNTRMPSSKSVA